MGMARRFQYLSLRRCFNLRRKEVFHMQRELPVAAEGDSLCSPLPTKEHGKYGTKDNETRQKKGND
jgi:hypothetical protein